MAASAPVRMEPIATLPVFFKLRGKRVILAGGGAPAVWKAELLSAAGAAVDVLALDPHPDLVAIGAAPPDGPVTIHRRTWTTDDLVGAALALGAMEEIAEARAFQAAARAAGVPVNVIDKPAFCDFQFGTIVSRSPLMIGISTDGAAPVFGQAIRARVEALLPQSLRAWAEAARDWRPALQTLELGFRARRRFWEVFAERALATPDGAPSDADRAECLAAVATGQALDREPRLTLIGAGRGQADGITLQAVKALQDADVVFVSDRVSPILTGYARREATRITMDSTRSDLDAVRQITSDGDRGRHRVWLDRGNPLTCQRWLQRRDALRSAGITPVLIEGLGMCEACTPLCPAWRDAAIDANDLPEGELQASSSTTAAA